MVLPRAFDRTEPHGGGVPAGTFPAILVDIRKKPVSVVKEEIAARKGWLALFPVQWYDKTQKED
ncbi:hypothetical protein D3Z51_00345 [Clostridiaceae bacterium]|nr:hypothetical protein [Clostridiaceae bacterium]RKI16509.1 hypothetical protein D7V81_04565 [bacterium 1XD21-70]